MKYYCKNCGCVVDVSQCGPPEEDKSNFPLECPVCAEINELERIPRYETPEQYHVRTGKDYPSNGLVWVKDSEKDEQGWRVDYYESALNDQRFIVVIADPPILPPDDYVPKGFGPPRWEKVPKDETYADYEYICPKCKKKIYFYEGEMADYDYCPHCGERLLPPEKE